MAEGLVKDSERWTELFGCPCWYSSLYHIIQKSLLLCLCSKDIGGDGRMKP